MRRRDVIGPGAVLEWPIATGAQRSELRRLAAMGLAQSSPQADGRLAAVRNGLHALGCIGGQKIETRWGTSDAASMTGRRTPKVNKGRRQQAFFAALAPRARAPDGTAWRPRQSPCWRRLRRMA